MDSLEEQCENAVFLVCDARERYPVLCAEELVNCIRLTNEINTVKVISKTKEFKDIQHLEEEQSRLLNTISTKKNISYEQQNLELKKMLDKIDNLHKIVEQIEKEKSCEINKLFYS